jgi:polyisoprenoid-binding protein YceI
MRILAALLLLGALAVAARADVAPLDLQQTTMKFTGHATLHDFTGDARDFHGSADVSPASQAFVTGAVIDIAAARLTTFNTTRDRHMFDWLQVEAHPKIEFHLDRVTPVGDPVDPARNLSNQFAVEGKFTLNGVTRTLATSVAGRRQGKYLIIDGHASIDTSIYGLPEIREFILTVDKNVDVTFHLVFDLPADAVAR